MPHFSCIFVFIFDRFRFKYFFLILFLSIIKNRFFFIKI